MPGGLHDDAQALRAGITNFEPVRTRLELLDGDGGERLSLARRMGMGSGRNRRNIGHRDFLQNLRGIVGVIATRCLGVSVHVQGQLVHNADKPASFAASDAKNVRGCPYESALAADNDII